MKLKEMYGRFYEKEEVEEFCIKKHITAEEFIREVVCYPTASNFVYPLLERLRTEGNVYVGGSIPINEKYLAEHVDEISDMANKVARVFIKRTTRKFDFDEINSRALEVIVTKCGNLVNNLEHTPDLLCAAMFNKAMRILKLSVKRKRRTIINNGR